MAFAIDAPFDLDVAEEAVSDYLRDNFGVSRNDATDAQMDEAEREVEQALMQSRAMPESRWTAESIRAFRHSQGWTQEALAHRLGVSWSTVRRWEAGKTPSPMALAALDRLAENPEIA